MSDRIYTQRITALQRMDEAADLHRASRTIRFVAGRASTPGLTPEQHQARCNLLMIAASILDSEATVSADLAVHSWRIHKEDPPYAPQDALRGRDSNRAETGVREPLAEQEGPSETDHLRDQASPQVPEASS